MTTPNPTPHPSRVVVDVTIAAPIERVWQALRDPALLAQWFGWDYDKLAEEIDVIFLAGGVEVEPGRRLDLGGDVFELEVGWKRDAGPSGARRAAGERHLGRGLRRRGRRVADVRGAARVLARGAAAASASGRRRAEPSIWPVTASRPTGRP